MNKIKQFFWMCSGADVAILKRCPSDANKYIGIGATIFFTGLLAAISASYALFTVFHSTVVAVLFGIIWGAMIFNLDRYIVSSMKKNNSRWKEFLVALPRIILALLIAVVISKPLELKIFESEINAELILMEQLVFKEQDSLIQIRYQSKIDQLNLEIPPLKKEMRNMAAHRDALAITAQQEADGTGGSMQRNLGPIYKAKKVDADKAENELIALTAKNQTLIDQKLKEIADIKNTIAAEKVNMGRGRLDGMAARIDALSNLTKKSEAILWANWFIILLFIAIESAPIFVKLISGKGPYDEKLEAHEYAYKVNREEQINSLTQLTKERIAVFNNESENTMDEKVAVGNELREKMKNAESEVATKRIDHWKEESLSKLNGQKGKKKVSDS